VDPPGDQTAQTLLDFFEKHPTSWPIAKAGSIAFFGKSSTTITHCGFCLNPYQMIEAAGGSARVRDKQSAVDAGAMVRVSLIKRRTDLIAVIYPDYASIGLT